MIDKYYNGVIEQVVSGIGNVEHNSILVRYSNDFSIWDLESVNHYKDQSDIFFTCHEFSYNKIAEAYEPYLGLIRQMFHRYCSGTLEEFMEECDVYKLQRPVFESNFENSHLNQLVNDLEEACRRFGFDGGVLPMLALGRTDGRFFGSAGSMVYGCSPLLMGDSFDAILPKVHGKDESILETSYEFGAQVLDEVIQKNCLKEEQKGDKK